MNIENNNEFESSIEIVKGASTMLSNEILKGSITNEEIFEMMHLDEKELHVKYIYDPSNKYLILSDIYENPYILYFTKGLSSDVLDYLPQFIKNRYISRMIGFVNEEEIEEVKDFEKDMKLLNYMFFESHEIGKRIYKTLKEKENEKPIVR